MLKSKSISQGHSQYLKKGLLMYYFCKSPKIACRLNSRVIDCNQGNFLAYPFSGYRRHQYLSTGTLIKRRANGLQNMFAITGFINSRFFSIYFYINEVKNNGASYHRLVM